MATRETTFPDTNGTPEDTIFGSATKSGAVTKSDTTVLDYNALYIGVTGDVVIKHTASGTAVTYKNVPVGILPVAGVRVMAATTASEIVWMKW